MDCSKYVKVQIENAGKSPRYAYTEIDNATLEKLLLQGEDVSKAEFEDLYDNRIPYASVRDKISSLQYYDDTKNSDGKYTPFGDIIGEVKDGEDARIMSIAISHLMSAQSAEVDSATKQRISETSLEAVQDGENEGNINIPYSNMEYVIGRNILKSKGIEIMPSNKDGFYAAVEEMRAEGAKALERLAEAGVLSINDSGAVINRRFLEDNNTAKLHKKGRSNRAPEILTGIKTVTLKPLMEKDASIEDTNVVMSKINAVKRLVNPVDIADPSTTPLPLLDDKIDIGLHKDTRDTLDTVQNIPNTVGSFASSAIDQIFKELDGSKYEGSSTPTSLAKLVQLVSGSKNSEYIFGTLDKDEVFNMLEDDLKGKEQMVGSSEAKILSFVRLKDAWSELKGKDLYYSFTVANNDRASLNEQTLNYQSDNFFARHTIRSPYEQELDEKETRYLLGYLSDETGLSPEEILGMKENEVLDSFLDDYSKFTPYEVVQEWGYRLAKGEMPYKGVKSVWEVANYIETIQDLRKGISEGKPVTTTFMPKPDATASGALITIAQAAGRSEPAMEVVQRMIAEDVNDAYTIALEELDSKNTAYKVAQEKGKMSKVAQAKYAGLDELNYLVDAGIIPSIREAVKIPFVTFIYGQAAKNNVQTTSEEITKMIIDSGKPEVIQEITQLDAAEIAKLSRAELRTTIIDSLAKDSGPVKLLIDTIQDSVGDKLFGEQVQDLTDSHKLLAEAVKDPTSDYGHIKIVPPLAVINRKEADQELSYDKMRKKHGASIEKYREVVIPSDNKSDLTMTKRKFPNETSIKVLLQHMTDSAIMFLAIQDVLQQPKFADYDNGIMLVHDSIGGDVEFAMAVEEAYKKRVSQVNSDYDFVEATLWELEYARSKTTNANLLKRLDAQIDSLQAKLPDQIARKQQILRNEIPASFGVKPKTTEAVAKLELKANMRGPKAEKVVEPKKSKVEEKKPQEEKWKEDPKNPIPFHSDSNIYIDEKSDSFFEEFIPKRVKSIQELYNISDTDMAKISSEVGTSVVDAVNTLIKETPGAIKLTNGSPHQRNGIVYVPKDLDLDVHTNKPFDTDYDKHRLLVEIFAHELYHADTTGFLLESTDQDIDMVFDIQDQIRAAIDSNTMDPDIVKRLQYVTNPDIFKKKESDPEVRKRLSIGELLAVYHAEPKYRKVIDSILKPKHKKGLKGMLKKFIDYVKAKFNNPKDITQLVADIQAKGETFAPSGKTTDFVNVVKTTPEPYKPKGYKASEKSKLREEVEQLDELVSVSVNTLDQKVSKAIQWSIDLSQDTIANTLKGKSYHSKMMKESKLYNKTVKAVRREWEHNSLVGKLKFYLSKKDVDFNRMASQALASEERKASFESDHINRLHKQLDNLDFTKNDMNSLYSMFSEVPMFALNKGGLSHKIFKEKADINTLIAEVEAKASTTEMKRAEALAELYINKVATDRYLHTDTEYSENVSTLSALYAIKKVPNYKSIISKASFDKKHRKFTQELLELSGATKQLDNEINTVTDFNINEHNGNLNHMTFEKPIQTMQVSTNNINHKLRSDLGWKVLRTPTKDTAGIIYRQVDDITFQAGIGTNLRLNPNPTVNLSAKYSTVKNNSVPSVSGDKGSKVVFTNDELTTLGVTRDPIASLVKAYSHRMMLLETQSIREEITEHFTYRYDNSKKQDILNDIKEDKHLWYIHLPEDVIYDELPTLIKAKYKMAKAKSNVSDFDQKVTLVRKDMEDFIQGYGEIQIGEVGSNLNKIFSVVKKSIILQKIHWIITNPVKIAMDTTSNIAYLMSRNVPVTTIYNKTKSISNDMANFMKIREELLAAEFANRVNPSKAKQKQIKNLEEKIRTHRLAAAHFNGFINSIAIELSSKNEHTVSGLHNDINKLLDTVFKDDKDSLNMAGKAVMKFSKMGVNGEDLLVKLANMVENRGDSDVGSAVAKSLNDMAEHVKTIKNKDEIGSYIQEYLGTPGSNMVAVGSTLTQMPDVISKVILQEHIVEQKVKQYRKENKGRNPSKAELEKINQEASLDALSSFIDYKVNIPKEFRFLEQTGVTSFISFWSRIQRVILTSLRDNPANAFITILINEIFDLNGYNIMSADLLERYGVGGIVGLPTPGLDIALPTKLIP